MTQAVLILRDSSGVWREARCDNTGALVVSGSAGGGGGGTSDTTELTQLAVKAAVQNIDAKTPALSGGAVPVAAASFGAQADARAAWYDAAASAISLLKLAVAAFVGAGSRTYTYTAGQLTSEAWTLFGTTRTKTYTYTAGQLTGESDWA